MLSNVSTGPNPELVDSQRLFFCGHRVATPVPRPTGGALDEPQSDWPRSGFVRRENLTGIN
jgi:hypothetical protein